jgi:rubrerythrin
MYYYTYPYWPQLQYTTSYAPTTVERSIDLNRAIGIQEKVLDALIEGMEGESEAIDFYTRLSAMAPNKEAKEAVIHALEDEKRHLDSFMNLYKRLAGNNPSYKKRRKRFSTFKEGIKLAYQDELEAYEKYRDDYLLTSDASVRDVFFLAMTDEIEHATRFAFVYQNLV